MSADSPLVRTTLRIPGDWAHPGELAERLPEGCQLRPEALHLADGSQVEFTPMPPDEEFPQIFLSSCRQPPDEDELATISNYSVTVGLSGAGGSLESALAMMQAGSAIVEAGGAGVFIDNCGLAHGGSLWQQMAEDGSSDALSYAFVGIVGGDKDVWTMGLQVLGFPDVIMRRADCDENAEALVEIVRYICGSDRPFEEGHIIAAEDGPRFQAAAAPGDERFVGSPMHNPFGRLKLTSIAEIAEGN